MDKSPTDKHPEVDLRKEHQGQTFLFSYGSNNPKQAAERLEVDYDWLCRHTVACEAIDRTLAFGLYSHRWEGGVANLARKQGEHCKGLAYLLPDNVLPRMDKYEGGYQKETIRLMCDGIEFKGVAYVQSVESDDFHYPSRRYLQAIGKTLAHYFHCKKALRERKTISIPVVDTNTLAEKGTEHLPIEELSDYAHTTH